MVKMLLFRFRWQVLLASFMSACSAMLGIKMLAIITEAIDSVKSGVVDPSSSFLVFTSIVIGVMLFGVVSQYILIRLSAKAVFEVQKTLLQRILSTPYQAMEKNGSHKLVATMKDDVSSISRGITLFPPFIFSSVTVILCLLYMAYISLKLFFLVLLVIMLIVSVSQIIMWFSLAHQKSLREDMDKFFSNLKALANGGKELQVSNSRRNYFYSSVMLPLFSDIKSKTVKTSLYFIALDSFSSTIVMFLIGCVVYTSLYFIPSIESAVIVSFTLIILYMVQPISNVVSIARDFNRARASLDKIRSLDLADASLFSLNSPIAREANWKSLRFDGVTYKHDHNEKDGYQFQLGPISTEFKAGEITFIVGGNGSGKSTFAKLIAGLYKPSAGTILLDDRDVGLDGIAQYKRSLSVIFSDFYIFSQILDSDGCKVSESVAEKYLSKLKLAGKVTAENGLLSSVSLSTGQNKRLAMLQSYCEDAYVCLFDEWAADQDPCFKKYFYHVLLPEMKAAGKIVIAITHDDQYFDVADKLIKLGDGLVVDNLIPVSSSISINS